VASGGGHSPSLKGVSVRLSGLRQREETAMTVRGALPAGTDGGGIEQPALVSECASAPVVAWDAQAAIYAALRASGPPASAARQTLAARLALRLAEQGYVINVGFTVADGTPFDAIRAALAEATSAAPGADIRPSVWEAPGGAILPADRSEATLGPVHALGSVREACAKRARRCLACGRGFEVNSRHIDTHRFCSAVCRSRHRRSEARHAAPVAKQEPPKHEYPAGRNCRADD
jgi:hypothetical protein